MARTAQTAPPALAEQAGDSPLAAGLAQALASLAAAEAERRPLLAEDLSKLLRRVEEGDGAAVASVLVRALDQDVLHGLESPLGVSTRSEAVSALLRLGYPWALQVRPEDLAFHRQQASAGWSRRVWLAVGLAAALLGGGLWAYWALVPPAPQAAPVGEQPARPGR